MPRKNWVAKKTSEGQPANPPKEQQTTKKENTGSGNNGYEPISYEVTHSKPMPGKFAQGPYSDPVWSVNGKGAAGKKDTTAKSSSSSSARREK